MVEQAPSTMLRMVPLPRFTGEDERGTRLAILDVIRWRIPRRHILSPSR